MKKQISNPKGGERMLRICGSLFSVFRAESVSLILLAGFALPGIDSAHAADTLTLNDDPNPGALLLAYDGNSGTFGHQAGTFQIPQAHAWAIRSDQSPQFLTFGPYANQLGAGTYVARFNLQVDNNTWDNNLIATIQVTYVSSNAEHTLAEKNITRTQFAASNVGQDFELTFTTPAGVALEFRVFYWGYSYLQHNRTQIIRAFDPGLANLNNPKSGAVLLAYFGDSGALGHQSGSFSVAQAHAWAIRSDQPSQFLTFGPYANQLGAGTYTARFDLQVDNNNRDNNLIATIQVTTNLGNVLAQRDITRTQFSAPNIGRNFDLTFKSTPGAVLEFRVFYWGSAYLQHNWTQILRVFDPRIDEAMAGVQGLSNWEPVATLRIPSTGPIPGPGPIESSNEGTQIVSANGTWYLFNRELLGSSLTGCPVDWKEMRIVVRKANLQGGALGSSWTDENVIAAPKNNDECQLADGHAYWDSETQTWHYLVQVLKKTGYWYVNHYTLQNPDPMSGPFTPDAANPVIQNSHPQAPDLGGTALWKKICGPGKACPSGTFDEGTPEISLKRNGSYYVTFHGANVSTGTVRGYRGVARTSDFHSWVVSDPSDPSLPNDAIWSDRDCKNWPVIGTDCVGGGHAATLLTSNYMYLFAEASDKSFGCTNDQNWSAGLVRAPAGSGEGLFKASGAWNQYSNNPFLFKAATACGIQYQRLFSDAGSVYMTYWDQSQTVAYDTVLKVLKLRPSLPNAPMTIPLPQGNQRISVSGAEPTALPKLTADTSERSLLVNGDGSLTLFDNFNVPLWTSRPFPQLPCTNSSCELWFQGDGNLVLYGSFGGWGTGTYGPQPDARSLEFLSGAPYLIIRNSSGGIIWQSN